MSAPDGQYCPHFARGRCTGCTRLHEPYAMQLANKMERVSAALKAVTSSVAHTTPSPMPMGYRTSVKWCLDEDREGRRAVGLYRQGTRDVVHIPDCPAAAAEIRDVTSRLFRKGLRPPARFYDHGGRSFQKGRLKFLIVRSSPKSGLGLVISHTGVPREDLAQWIKKAEIGKVSVYETRLSPKDRDDQMGRDVSHLAGPTTFTMRLSGRAYELTPEAFFQANGSLSDALIDAATAFSATPPDSVLLDLYGGFGAYSFKVASRFRTVHIVDGNAAAIRAAKAFAKAGKLDHVHAYAEHCETFLASLPSKELAAVTHVIVNPPRNGMSRTVTTTIGALPLLKDIHYVSCNPDTLARDLMALAPLGWRVVWAKPFDMFPQTEHVETVVRLARD